MATIRKPVQQPLPHGSWQQACPPQLHLTARTTGRHHLRLPGMQDGEGPGQGGQPLRQLLPTRPTWGRTRLSGGICLPRPGSVATLGPTHPREGLAPRKQEEAGGHSEEHVRPQASYPDSTPSTRFSMKKEPMTMSGTK